MNILITGATGLIGSNLAKQLLNKHHHVTALTRNIESAKMLLGTAPQYLSCLKELNSLDEFDAVINLAGEPIADKRWSRKQKRLIENSRWETTNQLAHLFQKSFQPPTVFISGSAIGYYGRQGNQPVNESFTQIHTEFSHTLCKKWEDIALKVQSQKTRVCLLRTGIVLSPSGGALAKMVLPFKLGLGGKIGNGQHYLPWIHITDMVKGIVFLLENNQCNGPYNFTAPHPVTNTIFSTTLANVLRRPCLFTTPKLILKVIFGEMADLLIYGQNVIPEKLEKEGFIFSYPQLKEALYDVLRT